MKSPAGIACSRLLCVAAAFAGCLFSSLRAQTEAPAQPVVPPAAAGKTEAVQRGAASESQPALNDTARLLAGLPPGPDGAFAALRNDEAFRDHAKTMDRLWAGLEKGRLSPIRQWAQVELGADFAGTSPVFYPFSGPDFTYVQAFYPNASTYILAGLEPVGRWPGVDSLRGAQLSSAMAQLRESLSAVVQFSFFKTKDMRTDFTNAKLPGITPVLLMMIARSEMEITSVEMVGLAPDGTVAPSSEVTGKASPGVRVRAHYSKGGPEQEIMYFCTDLSDSGQKANGGYTKLVEKLAPGRTFLKAASCLMHYSNFSTIRNTLLANSTLLVEDDSGIPLKYFEGSHWNLAFYGHYEAPIALFKDQYQADLRKTYATAGVAKPLPFGIGYRYRDQANLMVARKSSGAASPAPSAAVTPAATVTPTSTTTPAATPAVGATRP